VDHGTLKADLGRAKVVALPQEGDRAALAHHHAAMAYHARRHLRHHARPDDGAPQIQPHTSRLCTRRGSGNLALASKAATFREMGLEVSICGTENGLL